MTVNAGDVARITAEFTSQQSDDAQHVYHVQHVDGTDIGDQAFMDVVRDRLEVLYTDLEDDIAVTYTPIQITGKLVIGGLQVLPDTNWTGGLSFTNVIDPLPPQVAALIRAGTNISKVQGRKYIFGLTEEDQDAGSWTGTMITELAKYAANWIADFIVSGRTFRFGVVNTPPTLFRQFTNSVVNANSRTQRRRTIGRGS